MADGALVKAVQDIVEGNTAIEEINGRMYALTAEHGAVLVPAPPANTLFCHSLTAVVDWVLSGEAQREAGDGGLLISIEDQQKVSVWGELREADRGRDLFVSCTPVLPHCPVGQWMDQERFSVWLATSFVATDARARLLQVVGNIVSEESLQQEDDGVSQRVVARQGITRRTEVVLPPVVALQPYRTFHEVEQPESAFLLRMRRNEASKQAEVALFEADGGAWKLMAGTRISLWLSEALDAHKDEDRLVPPITILG
jgi:hypothetical protein